MINLEILQEENSSGRWEINIKIPESEAYLMCSWDQRKVEAEMKSGRWKIEVTTDPGTLRSWRDFNLFCERATKEGHAQLLTDFIVMPASWLLH